MKKILLYLFIVCSIFALLSSTAKTDKKDKKTIQKEKLSVKGSGIGEKLERIISYDISNSLKFLLEANYSSVLLNNSKSAAEEDSVPSWKLEMEYPDDYQMVTVQSEWDEANSMWKPTFKDIMYFRDDGMDTDSTFFFDYDTLAMDWKYSTRILSFYDNDGLIEEEFMYLFNDTTQSWEKTSKSVFEHDGNGNLILEWFYYWPPEDTGWTLTSKYVSTYNGNLKQQTETFTYTPVVEIWSPIFRTTYEYDNFDRMAGRISEMWDFLGNDYNTMSKEKFAYVGETQNTDTLYWLNYNTTDQMYTLNWFDKYNYNNENDLLVSIDGYSQDFEDDKSAMVEAQFSKTEATLYFFEDDEGGNGGDPSGADENKVQPVVVYPNPVENSVLINISNPVDCRLDVYNLEGKLMLTKNIHSKNTIINTEEFTNGTYILNISNNGERTIKKIVKR